MEEVVNLKTLRAEFTEVKTEMHFKIVHRSSKRSITVSRGLQSF